MKRLYTRFTLERLGDVLDQVLSFQIPRLSGNPQFHGRIPSIPFKDACSLEAYESIRSFTVNLEVNEH